ncbi:hypothetical protein Tco_0701707 [Tanacetum coccineum]
MSPSIEARITEHAVAPTPPLPVASPPLPLPSPLTTSPTDAGAPLGYRAAGVRIRAAAVSPPLLLPSTSHRTDIPEAEMPPQKKACFTTPALGLEIGESSAVGAVRQPGPTLEANTVLGIEFVRLCWSDIARLTWTGSEERSAAIEAHVRTLEAQVMAAPTIPISVEKNLRDSIDIRMNIIHPKPVAVVAFPAATVVRTLARHEEVIGDIQE